MDSAIYCRECKYYICTNTGMFYGFPGHRCYHPDYVVIKYDAISKRGSWGDALEINRMNDCKGFEKRLSWWKRFTRSK